MKKLNTLQLMWKIIMYKPWFYLLNCLLWTAIDLSPLIPGLITKAFLDNLETNIAFNKDIIMIIVLFASFALARVVVIVSGVYVDITHRFIIASLLRHNMLERILKLPGNKAIECAPGEVVTNFREDVEEIEYSISWTVEVIGTFIFAIVAVIILLSIDRDITMFVFFPLAIVVALAHLASKRVQKYRTDARNATSEVTSSIGEIFDSIQAVQVSASEEHIMNHFKELNKKRHKLMLKDSLFSQILDSIMFNTIHIGTGAILLLSAEGLKGGTFSVGDFALFVYYLGFIADFTHFWGYFIARYQQTGVAFSRLKHLMQGASDSELVANRPLYLTKALPKPYYKHQEEPLNLIEVRNLSYHHDENTGIKNINLKLPKGSFTVVTGRIGSGKTTLLRSILGLLPKQDGEILYNGKEITDPADFFVYPVASYTPQVPRLFSDEIRNNILLGLDETEVDINDAVYHAVLEDDLKHIDKGLDQVIGPKGMKLSGGQIQRVAAARMFVRKSQIYVLDDISSALDVDTERTLWNRLFENKDMTCLVVSNKRIALQNASNIIVLKDGKIEAQGTLSELLENCQEFKEIWG